MPTWAATLRATDSWSPVSSTGVSPSSRSSRTPGALDHLSPREPRGKQLAAGGLTWAAAGQVGVTFTLQMVIGLAVGLGGGSALLGFIRRVPLPNEALYPLRTVFCALALYGAGTVAHGSGFLAVFVAGILLGDAGAPYKREIERFHSALASFGEIVAFLVLGLTVDLQVLARADVWAPGLLLGVVLTVVIRPVFTGLCLLPARLHSNEMAFVLFAGLKGAVPILLGELLLPRRCLKPNGCTGSSSLWSCSRCSCREAWFRRRLGCCSYRRAS